jgi:hypothetical protein
MKPGAHERTRVDQLCGARDIAAKAAEGLGERAFNHVDPSHGAVARRNPGAARSVHADRVTSSI